MTTTQPFSQGTPGSTVDPAQLDDILSEMLRLMATKMREPLITEFAAVFARRASRHSEAAKILSKTRPKDDADLIAVEQLAQAAGRWKTHLETQSARLQKMPVPGLNDWTVFGTVTDMDGNPLRGLTARVFDRDRKYDDLLGKAKTNEFGDFSVVYHERDFKEAGENFPDLYVMVSDSIGNVLYSSRDSVRFEAGRSEYFAIRLEEPPQKTK